MIELCMEKKENGPTKKKKIPESGRNWSQKQNFLQNRIIHCIKHRERERERERERIRQG